jgi:hypothetical protein
MGAPRTTGRLILDSVEITTGGGSLSPSAVTNLRHPRPLLAVSNQLDNDMEVNAQQHERPEEHGQEEGEEFADAMDRVSVSQCYHHTDNYVCDTE